MAKMTGLGWTTFSVDDASGTPRDIRNDVTSLSFATPRESQDVTGIDKSAYERLLLLSDFTCEPEGVFNPASNLSHDVLKTVPSTSVARTTTIAVGGATLAGELLYNDYSIERSSSGELTWSTTGELADGTVPTWA